MASILLVSSLYAAEESSERVFKNDFKTAVGYLLKGSYTQFMTTSNLYYAGVAVPTLWYAFENDKEIVARAAKKDIPKHMEITGDLGVICNFPIIPLGAYYWGRRKKDNRLIQFSMELAASLYLALAETAILSWIPVHDRPNKDAVTFWETAFRQDSSFPSGHVVPFATLFLKTFQFYGPYYAIVPAAMFYLSATQRVRDEKHYLSDVLGGFFLAAWASEGVRAVAKYKDNHPVYKWLFEHDARVGIIHHRDKIGPRLTWNY